MTENKNITRQAGALPYIITGEGIQVLLITTRRSVRWSIPKGIIDRGETAHDAARRECLEEAGVSGHLADETTGAYEYTKFNRTFHVTVFPLLIKTVHATYAEQHARQRRYFPIKTAIQNVKRKKLKKILKRFNREMSPGEKHREEKHAAHQ